MKKYSSTEIEKGNNKYLLKKEIIEDFIKYKTEKMANGENDTESVPFFYTFAMNKAKEGCYKGFNEQEICSLLKKEGF